MLEDVDIIIENLLQSKLAVVLKAIETLLITTNHIKYFVVRFNNYHGIRTPQPMLSIISQRFSTNDSLIFPNQ